MAWDVLHDLLEHIRKDPTNRRPVLEISQEAGFRLPHRDLRALRRAVQDLSGTARELEDEYETSAMFAVGALTSLAEVITSFDVEVVRQRERTEVDAVADHPARREVLLALADGVTKPSAIAERTGKTAPQVTRMLQDLRSAGLCEIDPRPSSDQRTRPHRLTPLGQDVVEDLAARQYTEHIGFLNFDRFLGSWASGFALLTSKANVDVSQTLERGHACAADVKEFLAKSRQSGWHMRQHHPKRTSVSAN